jgi:hypothetical protein
VVVVGYNGVSSGYDNRDSRPPLLARSLYDRQSADSHVRPPLHHRPHPLRVMPPTHDLQTDTPIWSCRVALTVDIVHRSRAGVPRPHLIRPSRHGRQMALGLGREDGA